MKFSTLFSLNSIPSLDLDVRQNRIALDDLRRDIHPILDSLDGNRRPAFSGLALAWHDYWKESHETVQDFEGHGDCDLIHAILHRREGDLSNTQYWLRSVGMHPAFANIAATLKARQPNDPESREFIQNGKWNPQAFAKSVIENPRDPRLKAIQALEMMTLAKLWWPETRQNGEQGGLGEG